MNVQIRAFGEPGQESVQGRRPTFYSSIIGMRGAGLGPGCGRRGGLGVEGSGCKRGQGKAG